MWEFDHIIGCFTTHVRIFSVYRVKVKDHAPLYPGENHFVCVNLHIIGIL